MIGSIDYIVKNKNKYLNKIQMMFKATHSILHNIVFFHIFIAAFVQSNNMSRVVLSYQKLYFIT